MTTQEKMQAKLGELGIPAKEIRVFGSQILITARSLKAAQKWARTLARFAKVRGIGQGVDYNQDQSGRQLAARPVTHTVWRVSAYIA